MTRLRLAIVSDAVHPWHTGGKETRYEQLLNRIPTETLDVTVYTMRWWKGAAPTSPVRHRALMPRVPMYTGTRRSMLQGILFALACLQLLFRGRFDAIEADHMPYLQLYPLRIVAWVRRVPLIVTWHEVWGPAYWDEYLGGPAGRLAAQIEKYATRLPDVVVAVSECTAERLRELGTDPARILVLWAGVNVNELNDVTAAEHGTDLVYAGRLIEHKRVDMVLDALAHLNTTGEHFTCTIIGDGPERARLEQHATSIGVGGQVQFLGSLEHVEDVWSHMKAARVFAFPSEREGFGFAVAEALAAGTPPVVVDHASNASRHLVDDGVTGSIVPSGDVDAFASALSHWVHTDENHQQTAMTFEERHPHLSWTAMAERYIELVYTECR